MNLTMKDALSREQQIALEAKRAAKHPGSICVANYKGGVGKTTLVCLLGYYLAQTTGKKVLLIDIDPQCSLSLAVGFDPEEVSKTELTIYTLAKPTKWAKILKTNFSSYALPVPDLLAPPGLHIIRGSFEVENLDIEIVQSVVRDKDRRVDELFLYCKQMLHAFDEYDYIVIDCPPNKMYLTQAMLRACSFYLPVTIPDAISVYGMPRLLRWVKDIPSTERPKLLGYVLNAVNRTGGPPGGMVYSQQAAIAQLPERIVRQLESDERSVVGNDPCLGKIPRLDAIARFLGDVGAKTSRFEFPVSRSSQDAIDTILRSIVSRLQERMASYRAIP